MPSPGGPAAAATPLRTGPRAVCSAAAEAAAASGSIGRVLEAEHPRLAMVAKLACVCSGLGGRQAGAGWARRRRRAGGGRMEGEQGDGEVAGGPEPARAQAGGRWGGGHGISGRVDDEEGAWPQERCRQRH